MPLTFTLIIISFSSPTLSFIPDLKLSFSANPSHCSPSFSTSGLTTWFPRLLLLLLAYLLLLFFLLYNFYRAMLCIHGTSHGPVSVCLCLCSSVTSRGSTKTAKSRITQTTPQDTPGTIVFWSQRSPRNSTGPLRGRQMQVRLVKIGDFWPIAGYISKTVQDRHIVSIKVE